LDGARYRQRIPLRKAGTPELAVCFFWVPIFLSDIPD
jgi:hypothetical protein